MQPETKQNPESFFKKFKRNPLRKITAEEKIPYCLKTSQSKIASLKTVTVRVETYWYLILAETQVSIHALQKPWRHFCESHLGVAGFALYVYQQPGYAIFCS